VGFFEGMGFPEPEGDDEPEFDQPEWFGAPEGWVGGVVPLELLVAKNEEAAVYVTGLVAYPVGFSLEVNTQVRSRRTARGMSYGWHGHHGMWPHDLTDVDEEGEGLRSVDDLPPELLRFGLQYSDGRKASSFGSWLGGRGAHLAFWDEDEGQKPDPDKDLILMSGGGGGGETHTTQRYWVWPLPPEGPVTFVCEWPKLGIPETSAEIDGEVMRGAADRAQQIWT
jgi:hypothetical protein